MNKLLIAMIAMLIPFTSFSAEEEELKMGFNHQSEAGFVKTGGNTDSETLSIKQDTYYKWSKELLRWTGSYISTKAAVPDANNSIVGQTPVITVENYATALRYERTVSPALGVYAQAGIAGDRFQGVFERKTGGLGLNYHVMKTANFWWDFEAGYEYTRELIANATPNGNLHPEYHFARAFTAMEYAYSKAVMFGLSVEYLLPFSDNSGSGDNSYRLNFSPYLISVLSDNFSLKVSYDGRYRNVPVNPTLQRLDYTFSTTLLATY